MRSCRRGDAWTPLSPQARAADALKGAKASVCAGLTDDVITAASAPASAAAKLASRAAELCADSSDGSAGLGPLLAEAAALLGLHAHVAGPGAAKAGAGAGVERARADAAKAAHVLSDAQRALRDAVGEAAPEPATTSKPSAKARPVAYIGYLCYLREQRGRIAADLAQKGGGASAVHVERAAATEWKALDDDEREQVTHRRNTPRKFAE